MAKDFVMGSRMTLKDKFSKPIKDVKKASQLFTKSIQSANSETGKMVNGQLRARDSMDNFGRETKQTTNNLKEQRTATNKLGSGMRMLKGLIVGVAGSMAAVAGKKWLIDSNASMETYQNTLAVVMGSQDKAIKQLEWAEKFAGNTPFQIDKVVEATTRLEAYGLQSQKVLGITGDMASVMGKDLMQAVEAVADAQTGEVERLKEFGITKGMIEEQAALLGTMPINNKGQITDYKAFNAALFSLMEKKFKGGMAMQMDTWNGMLSNAADFWSKLGRTLGKPIFENLKIQLKGLIDYFALLEENGTIDAWTAKVEAGVTAIGSAINTYVKPGINFLISAASTVKSNWDWIGPFVNGLAITLGGYLAITKGIAVYQAISTGVMWAYNAAITAYQSIGIIAIGITEGWTGVQAALNLVMSANPIGLVVIAIAALVGGLILAYKKSEAFRDIVNSVWSTIWNKVQPIVSDLKAAITNAFTAVLAWVNTYWPKIQQIISFVWAFIGPYVTAIVKNLKLVVVSAFNLILTTIRRAMGMIGGIIKIGWSIISGVFGIGLSLLTGDWSGAWDAMLDMLSGVWTGIKQFFGNLGGLFLEAGSTIITTLVQGIMNSAMAPVNAVKNVFAKVRNLLPFSDAKEGPFSQLTESGKSIIKTVTDGLLGQAGSIYKTVTNIFTNIKDFALNPIEAILSGVSTVFSGVENSILKVYNWVVGVINKIPKMFLPKSLENLKPIEIQARVKSEEFAGTSTASKSANAFKEAPATTVSPEAILSGVSSVFGGVENSILKVYKTVTNIFTNIKDFALNSIEAILSGVVNKIPKMLLLKSLENLKPIEIQARVKSEEFAGTSTASKSANAFKEAPATTVRPEAINPRGSTTTDNSKRTIIIEKMIEKLELNDVGNKDVGELVEEIISQLHARLADADEILSTGEMGVLLNG